jgi:hypothetical protein
MNPSNDVDPTLAQTYFDACRRYATLIIGSGLKNNFAERPSQVAQLFRLEARWLFIVSWPAAQLRTGSHFIATMVKVVRKSLGAATPNLQTLLRTKLCSARIARFN